VTAPLLTDSIPCPSFGHNVLLFPLFSFLKELGQRGSKSIGCSDMLKMTTKLEKREYVSTPLQSVHQNYPSDFGRLFIDESTAYTTSTDQQHSHDDDHFTCKSYIHKNFPKAFAHKNEATPF